MYQKLLAFSLLALASASRAGVVSIDPAGFSPGTNITRAFEHVTLFTLAPDFTQGVPVEPELPAVKYIPVYAVRCPDCSGPLTNRMMFGTDIRFLNPNGGLSPTWWYANFADLTLTGTPHIRPDWQFDALLVQFDQPTDFVQFVNSGNDSGQRGNYFRITAWDEHGRLILTCASLPSGDLTVVGGLETPTPHSCSANKAPIPSQMIPLTLTMRTGQPRIAFVTAGGWAGGRYAFSMKYNQLDCGHARHHQPSNETDVSPEDSQESPE